MHVEPNINNTTATVTPKVIAQVNSEVTQCYCSFNVTTAIIAIVTVPITLSIERYLKFVSGMHVEPNMVYYNWYQDI